MPAYVEHTCFKKKQNQLQKPQTQHFSSSQAGASAVGLDVCFFL